jgi:hypothetical protein
MDTVEERASLPAVLSAGGPAKVRGEVELFATVIDRRYNKTYCVARPTLVMSNCCSASSTLTTF